MVPAAGQCRQNGRTRLGHPLQKTRLSVTRENGDHTTGCHVAEFSALWVECIEWTFDSP